MDHSLFETSLPPDISIFQADRTKLWDSLLQTPNRGVPHPKRPSADQANHGPGATTTTTLKDQETLINELKKENFSLKLRIYHMEEELKFASPDTQQYVNVNIELKIEVSKLKEELDAKTQLLFAAQTSIDQLEGLLKKNKQLETLVSDYQKKIESFGEEFRIAEDHWMSEKSIFEKTIFELEQSVEELKTELYVMSRQQQNNNGQSSKNNNLKGDSEAQEEHLRHLESLLRDSQQANRDLEGQIDGLASELRASRTTISELHEALQSARSMQQDQLKYSQGMPSSTASDNNSPPSRKGVSSSSSNAHSLLSSPDGDIQFDTQYEALYRSLNSKNEEIEMLRARLDEALAAARSHERPPSDTYSRHDGAHFEELYRELQERHDELLDHARHLESMLAREAAKNENLLERVNSEEKATRHPPLMTGSVDTGLREELAELREDHVHQRQFISELQLEIETLHSVGRGLQKENDTLHEYIGELQQQMASFHKLSKNEADVNKGRHDVSFGDAYEQLLGVLKERDLKIEQLISELKEKETNYYSLMAKINALEATLGKASDWEKERKSFEAQRQEMASQLDALQRAKDEQERKLCLRENEAFELTHKLQAATRSTTTATAEMQAVKGELEQMQSELRNMQQEYSALLARYQSIETSQNGVEELKQLVASLTTTKEELIAKSAILEQKMEEKDSQSSARLREAARQVFGFQEQIAQHKRDLLVSHDNLALCKRELAASRQELEEARSAVAAGQRVMADERASIERVSRLEGELLSLESMLAQTRNDLHAEREENALLKSKCAELEDQNQRRTDRLNEASRRASEAATLQSENQRLKGLLRSHEDAEKSFAEQLSRLQVELAAAQRTTSQAREEAHSAASRAAILETDLKLKSEMLARVEADKGNLGRHLDDQLRALAEKVKQAEGEKYNSFSECARMENALRRAESEQRMVEDQYKQLQMKYEAVMAARTTDAEAYHRMVEQVRALEKDLSEAHDRCDTYNVQIRSMEEARELSKGQYERQQEALRAQYERLTALSNTERQAVVSRLEERIADLTNTVKEQEKKMGDSGHNSTRLPPPRDESAERAYQFQVESLKRELASERDLMHSMEEQLSSSQAETARLSALLHVYETKQDDELSSLRASIAQARSENKDLHSRLSALSAQLPSSPKKPADSNDLADKRGRDELLHRIRLLEAQAQDSQREVEEYKTAASRAREEKAALDAALSSKTTDHDALKVKMAAVQGELVGLNKQASELLSAARLLEAENTSLRKQLGDAQSHQRIPPQDFSHLEGRVALLQQENTALFAKYEALQKELEGATNRARSSSSLIDNKDQEILLLNQANQDLKEKAASLKHNNDLVRRELDTLRHASSLHALSEGETKQLKLEVASMARKNEDLHSMVASLTKQIDARRDHTPENFALISGEIESVRRENKSLHSALQVMEERMRAMSSSERLSVTSHTTERINTSRTSQREGATSHELTQGRDVSHDKRLHGVLEMLRRTRGLLEEERTLYLTHIVRAGQCGCGGQDEPPHCALCGSLLPKEFFEMKSA